MTPDWSHCAEVSSSPEMMGGAWVFKGSRLTLEAVFANWQSAGSVEELLDLFDTNVTAERLRSVIEFASNGRKAYLLESR